VLPWFSAVLCVACLLGNCVVCAVEGVLYCVAGICCLCSLYHAGVIVCAVVRYCTVRCVLRVWLQCRLVWVCCAVLLRVTSFNDQDCTEPGCRD
jgi:hypothetical protein